jgi:fatty-acyl-CoA synthase
MDADGYIRLVGRRKDMYISGGENVYPAEVERVLEQHPDVLEAAVVGVPDPEWGETGRAYVVCKNFDADALARFARTQLAHYKCPKQWVRVDQLPRTASGKVEKHRLLERDRA